MPNSYFQFKQFRINQDRSAMKVCTDSCILGAYANVSQAKTILDIGTGTGLLALMIAQRTAAAITAIEIDEQAAQQAQENVNQSPWAEKIRVKPVSLQVFGQEHHELFDVIVCNPPFYKESFKSVDEARNVAMHSPYLSFGEIIQFCVRALAQKGLLYLLLPPPESHNYEQLALAHQLHIQEKLHIYNKTNGKHIRTISVYGLIPATNIPEKQLFIRQSDNAYTPEFQKLLSTYYLIF